ncbi:MAG: hypothetical protein AVDCRST_MAG71-2509, partial [uncultured Lysobacter sp.]
ATTCVDDRTVRMPSGGVFERAFQVHTMRSVQHRFAGLPSRPYPHAARLASRMHPQQVRPL